MKKLALCFAIANLYAVGLTYAGTMGAVDETNWTGLYLGANGGAGWGNPSNSMTYLKSGQIESGITWYPTNTSQNFSGAVFGGQIGYDYQFMSKFLLGLKYDTDFGQWTGYNKSASGDSTGSLAKLYSSQKLNWFGHLLPRLGYLINNSLLLYGTGGLLFGSIHGTANQVFSYSPVGVNDYPATFKINTTGWSAGAGIEWKMIGNWSLGIEYLYNEFGNNSVIANNQFPSRNVSSLLQNLYEFSTNFQTVALAVNYHWSM